MEPAGSMTPLAEASILFTIAQVSVLFAGFGGVSSVLGKLQTKLQRVRLRNVIFTAVLLLMYSLFPFLPNQFGLEPEVTWRISTAALGVFTVIFYAASGDLKLFREANRLDQSLIAGDFVILAILIASTLGYFLVYPSTAYIVALFWHLLSACLMFIMVFSPIWDAEDED